MTASPRRAAKRIDPKTRGMAEALARQSGVSLSDWAAALSAADDLKDALLIEGAVDAPREGGEGERLMVPGHPTDDVLRVSKALEALSERLEAAETRAALAVSGVDKQVREAFDRLEGGEREQTAATARLDGAVGEATAELSTLSERLAHIEAEGRGPRSAEALRSLEAALGTVAAHLYRGESRTEESIAAIRVKVERMEAERADPTLMNEAALAILGIKARLETLSGKIAAQEETIRAAEQRSQHAIERMGAEVVEVSQSLIRRVQAAEARGAESIEQVGGEVSRVAATMEARLGRADAVQALALDKLGAEIEHIAERLAERIATSDRRSAQAIDEVGDQVALITERLGQRQERATDDLGDRIRQSEERTAALLKEARQTIAKLSAGVATDSLAEDVGEAEAPAAAAPFVDHDVQSPAPEGFPAFRAPAIDDADAGEARTIAFEPLADESEAASIEVASDELHPDPDPFPPPVDRSAAGAQSAEAFSTLYGRSLPASTNGAGAKPRSFTGIEGPIFTGLSFRAPRRRGAVKTAALGVGMAAAFGVALGGFFVAESQPPGGLVTKIAYLLSRSHRPDGLIRTARSTPGSPLPHEAVALGPVARAGDARQAGEVAAMYAAAVASLEANDPKGAQPLRHAADLGYAPAQFYLAKLYETGTDGVGKDLGQARRWTQRAAEGGDPRAMHNLALYEFEGTGGAKNVAIAADWFRRAAVLGLVDSQYNLGRLYEEGYGVAQNTAEAYKWYLIASRSGDAQSKSAAARVKPSLSPDARAVAERAAAEFKPTDPQPTPAAGPSGAGDVVTAQRGLSALGYYQGPIDGVQTPALKLALSSYQRDQGLPMTGATDSTTVGRLQAVNP